ncbi:type II toxin-antitoxin system RelE/ParE family toxin [Lacihabitans sp. LS3-19]|uniref:type II toxin-antitoxin system RelE/ParE family toxin n=1 Tax=Lacihabitans sp. LS3-19 TaxID=2487335 RepID=UPI0020CBF3C4|nr:type II toxin-antitoxin system RelE/ParE family toxin [Lacihabitans sp. LS3-19]MCP9767167.1 type II toxin-antitoxin system RelE/ParE family toxin [Lacihabitans sp. LS3-19]
MIITISELAFEDLESIFQYTFETLGIKKAIDFKENLYNNIQKLSQMTTMGHKHKNLSEELRIYNFEYHSIIYDFTETHLQIIRIVNQRRNIEDLT